MWLWVTIFVLILLAPRLLRLRARHQARAGLLRMPLPRLSFSEAAADTINPAIRDALAQASVDLDSLGFALVGYIQLSELNASDPRTFAVLRHPGELSFAVVGFHIADQQGATVDFETLFADGWWLRTVNRRGHFFMAPLETGRIADPYVATIGEQWQHHRQAIALETTRSRHDADLADLVVHRNAVEEESIAADVKQGLLKPTQDGQGMNFTREGADDLLRRLTDAAARSAAAPPLSGVLAMRNPPEELERKFQHILRAQASGPKRGKRWAFLLSVIVFAASAMLFKQWAWLLWIIPFLLFHELGHWATMRLFGHRDARIRFIPLLGAATLTTTRFRKLSHEMIVLLAGPVPGIVLGLLLFQLIDFARSPYMLGTAITLVAINVVNLLPLYPLDGGRILHALVTAGRPRLDLALKVVAAALFVAGAIALKDPVLAILAAAGFLFLRPGWRLARLDDQIRRQPGFGPALTPEQRRQFIFDALPEQERTGGTAWVQLVQQIEVSLSHGQARLGQALPWAAVYVACLGGLIAWGVNLFTAMPPSDYRCPPRSHARALACGAPAAGEDINWSHPEPGTLTRNPFKLVSEPEYPFGAFVWCTGEGTTVRNAWQALWESAIASNFCPALPWEAVPAETRSQHGRARRTVFAITGDHARPMRDGLRENLERLETGGTEQQDVDAETLALYRTWLDSGEADGPARRLSDRLGRSPTESCRHIKILRVVSDASAQNADAGRDEDSGFEKSDPAETAVPRMLAIRLSVLVTTPADLTPLQRYLCETGCRVDVLPYGSMDRRLHGCF